MSISSVGVAAVEAGLEAAPGVGLDEDGEVRLRLEQDALLLMMLLLLIVLLLLLLLQLLLLLLPLSE